MDEETYLKSLVIPEGYTFDAAHGWHLIIREDRKADCRLTNRTFGDADKTPQGDEISDINFQCAYKISQCIGEAIRRKGKALVLDLGCGPLNTAAMMVADTYKKNVYVHAVDITDSTMRYKRPNLKRHVADARDIPIDPCSVDVVYSYELFHHVPDEDKIRMLDEVLRVMAPNGRAVLDILSPNPETNRWLKEFDSIDTLLFPISLAYVGYDSQTHFMMVREVQDPRRMCIGGYESPRVMEVLKQIL